MCDFSHYSFIIRTIRRLFVHYSDYSQTIRPLFVLYSHYSLDYSASSLPHLEFEIFTIISRNFHNMKNHDFDRIFHIMIINNQNCLQKRAEIRNMYAMANCTFTRTK